MNSDCFTANVAFKSDTHNYFVFACAFYHTMVDDDSQAQGRLHNTTASPSTATNKTVNSKNHENKVFKIKKLCKIRSVYFFLCLFGYKRSVSSTWWNFFLLLFSKPQKKTKQK